MRIVGAIIGAAALCGAMPAEAQNAEVLARIRQMDAAAPAPTAEALAPVLLEAATRAGPDLAGCVAKSITVETISPITGDAAVLRAVIASNVSNGWAVYGRTQGCADPDPLRFMALRRPDGALVAVMVNRGRSNVSPSIMRDTSSNAAIAALGLVKREDASCTGEGMRMERTRIDREDAGLGPDLFGIRYKGGWREIWTFGVCGRSVELPVTFTADGDGGAHSKVEGSAAAVLPRR